VHLGEIGGVKGKQPMIGRLIIAIVRIWRVVAEAFVLEEVPQRIGDLGELA
jgi:hypothetical protein